MIALLGGTFDPVHVGHVAAALEARRRLAIDEVRLVLARQPYHKERSGAGADATDRLAMLGLACAGHPGLVADGSELEHEGPSYTVDLLERRARHDPAERRCWVMGSDAFALILGWRRVEDLFGLTSFLVFRRRDDGAGNPFGNPSGNPSGNPFDAALDEFIRPRRVDRLAADRQGQVMLVDADLPAVSSTAVRAALRAGKPVADWLSPGVLDYIRKHHLYGTSESTHGRIHTGACPAEGIHGKDRGESRPDG